jgi:hypothetical protein
VLVRRLVGHYVTPRIDFSLPLIAANVACRVRVKLPPNPAEVNDISLPAKLFQACGPAVRSAQATGTTIGYFGATFSCANSGARLDGNCNW